AEGPGLLMHRFSGCKAYLHCSSTAVYEPAGASPRAESAPLGDNHRGLFETYSITKIAGEAVVRTMAKALELPTTIARLNVPYGPRCGFPYFHFEMMRAGATIEVHPDKPNFYNPIHLDDIIAMVPGLLRVASVPATVLNWAGPATVSIQEWCDHIAALTGLEPRFADNPAMVASVVPDVTRLNELVGPAKVGWKDGIEQMISDTHPECLLVPSD